MRFASGCWGSLVGRSWCARRRAMQEYWVSRICAASPSLPSVWRKRAFAGRKPCPIRRCIELYSFVQLGTARFDAEPGEASASARVPDLRGDLGAVQLLRHESALGPLPDQELSIQ